jgi:hypothetical protein
MYGIAGKAVNGASASDKQSTTIFIKSNID